MATPKRKSSGKPPYQMKNGDSLSKFFLLGAILHDVRSRDIHHKAAWHILERWYEDWGNGLASVGFLAKQTGLSRGSVATATADLCAWGYFSRNMGSGKRATSYVPNWAVSRVLWLSDSNDGSVLQSPDVSSVLQSPDTLVLPRPDGNPGCVLQSPDQPLLPYPLTSGVTVEKSSGAGGSGLAPARRAKDLSGEITGAHVDGDDLLFEIGGAPVVIHWQHANTAVQDAGQKELNLLAQACGLPSIDTGTEINGKRVTLTTRASFEDGATPERRFSTLAANDNEPADVENIQTNA